MTIMTELLNHHRWLKFLEYKKNQQIDQKEWIQLEYFIQKKKYQNIGSKILSHQYSFSIPRKIVINKKATKKKRVVYRFTSEENIILKYISFLLYEYDSYLYPNCYSFRRNTSPKDAFQSLVKKQNQYRYGYKLDIKNYFNSIDISILLRLVKQLNDVELCIFLEKILLDCRVFYKGKIIEEQKGVMAGTPISCFLSNLYLREMDKFFEKDAYARYADDIIIFTRTKKQLEIVQKQIREFLNQRKLEINPEKEYIFYPQESWTFLGFSYNQGMIDLSKHTKDKIKAKIRRKTRALKRWQKRKNVSSENTMKALCNIFNYKFFDGKRGNELN